jgi:hypothetical protein
MRLTLAALFLTTLVPSARAQDATVASLLSTTRAAIRAGRSDADVARAVATLRLTECLDDAVVEQLETEGAGRETLDALDRQRDVSREKPKPSAALSLFDAPAPPSVEDRTAALEKARESALQYNAGLPNFLCTETVHRYVDPKKTQAWTSRDWYTLAMGFSKKGEQYKLTTLNGKPTKATTHLGGFTSHGEFGGILGMIFEPKFATSFQWERWSLLRGRLVYVFSYLVDQAHSKYTISLSGFLRSSRTTCAMRGAVYVDRDTHQVLRYTDEGVGIPASLAVVRSVGGVDYDFADIAGQKYLLPRRAFSRIVLKDGQTHNVIEFSDYRKFTGESTLIFDK